jgi:hypothetical protein
LTWFIRFLCRYSSAAFVRKISTPCLKSWCNGADNLKLLQPGRTWKLCNNVFLLLLLGGKQVFKGRGMSATGRLQRMGYK